MAPYILIGIVAVVGLLGWGIPGLIGGGVVGYALAFLLGETYNKIQGGAVPRKAREALIARLLAEDLETVQAALPGRSGQALYSALDDAINILGRRAISLSPNNSVVWTDRVVLAAVEFLILEQPTPAARALYQAIGKWIAVDWYG